MAHTYSMYNQPNKHVYLPVRRELGSKSQSRKHFATEEETMATDKKIKMNPIFFSPKSQFNTQHFDNCGDMGTCFTKKH